MRKIELVEGIHSSVLGLGCAPVMGSVDSKTCRRALSLAYEHGITHFDLARSYGYGDAEALVGRVFKNKRDRIVLASKFGIKANWKAGLLRPIKPIVRLLRDSEKRLNEDTGPTREEGNTTADLFLQRIEINGTEMRKSLEKSLKALKTDYLDYFMVHEPLYGITNIDEIFDTAARLKADGKIRAFGLAFKQSQKYLHESYYDRFDILQIDSPRSEQGYRDLVEERSGQPNIFFSPLRGAGVAISPGKKIEKLIRDFPKSVVLCSMFSEKHLIENAEIATHTSVPDPDNYLP
ncbi:Aldo/keto reductase family protein [Dyadobacter sp. SG02]|uniref:aldo/keto reductase n=1 Tax=Dyadobacter sp. SG02 TaxID=1855291 RepID=UPI0008CE6CB1|nr:aldo/keto reductase [Dyadobacter sp. SG02]SEJ39207.1 Aldo/keto reductase family protein [Dyadobacter sp. SG02]